MKSISDMQVAAFLSDLKSLSVCSHEAAVDVVSVHKSAINKAEEPGTGTANSNFNNEDNDRKRADELALLHRNVKLKHVRTPDADLVEARTGIRRILQDLERD